MNDSGYETTSNQLDHITTTVITTILSGFIIVHDYLVFEQNGWLQAAGIFALTTLLIHYASFITAHYSQIYKIKKEDSIYKFFSAVTHKINVLVYILVLAEFIISVLIIIYK